MRKIVVLALALFVPVVVTTGASGQVAPAAASTGHAAGRDPASIRVERQIALLHRQLAITDAQTPQWQAFAQVMRENAQHMDTLFEQRLSDASSRTAPEDMASYAVMAKAHGDDVGKLVQPFSDLYATMSDAQRKTADSVFRRAEGRQATQAHHG